MRKVRSVHPQSCLIGVCWDLWPHTMASLSILFMLRTLKRAVLNTVKNSYELFLTLLRTVMNCSCEEQCRDQTCGFCF